MPALDKLNNPARTALYVARMLLELKDFDGKAYLDGSRHGGSSQGPIGVGIHLQLPDWPQFASVPRDFAIPVAHQGDNVDAETAAVEKLGSIFQQFPVLRKLRWAVIMDCVPAIRRIIHGLGLGRVARGHLLHGMHPGSGKARFLQGRRVLRSSGSLHVGVCGNERADEQAKIAAALAAKANTPERRCYKGWNYFNAKLGTGTRQRVASLGHLSTKFKSLKPAVGPWPSKLGGSRATERYLAALRLSYSCPLSTAWAYQGILSGHCAACQNRGLPRTSASVCHYLLDCPAWDEQRQNMLALVRSTLRIPRSHDLRVQTLLGSEQTKLQSWVVGAGICNFVKATVGKLTN